MCDASAADRRKPPMSTPVWQAESKKDHQFVRRKACLAPLRFYIYTPLNFSLGVKSGKSNCTFVTYHIVAKIILSAQIIDPHIAVNHPFVVAVIEIYAVKAQALEPIIQRSVKPVEPIIPVFLIRRGDIQFDIDVFSIRI